MKYARKPTQRTTKKQTRTQEPEKTKSQIRTESLAEIRGRTFSKTLVETTKHAKDSLRRITTSLEGRRDFRTIPTCTIDPETAQDFDDALSITSAGTGLFELGIHIADVSHFVPFNNPIDREAQKRGTSVYLVEECIPMLPEELSNDVCSLKPHEDRLTFSVVATLDTTGAVQSVWMGKSVINSRKRFTYKEAQKHIDTGTGVLAKELRTIMTIARALKRERIKHGAIEFASEEVGFTFKNGVPVDAFIKPVYETMSMIEECMLLANRLVASYIHKRVKAEKHMIGVYRVHEAPNGEKLHALETLLIALGYKLHKHKGMVTSQSIERILEAAHDTPEFGFINLSLLRAMPKAVYDYRNTGHFGLGFTHYTHFTSPIRRYPDLMVHRLLYALLSNKVLGKTEVETYKRLCEKNTQQEIGAQDAERDSIKDALVLYWKDRLNTPCSGTVSGVMPYGIFVQDAKTHAEGFIHITKLREYGYLYYNAETMTLENEHSLFRLGEAITFVFSGIREDRNQLEAEILD